MDFSKPYLVHLEERPLRKTWIIPRDASLELLLTIIEKSLNSWAGRAFPIIAVNSDGSIEDYEWNMLKAYDPDVIVSFCQLSDEILKKIQRDLSPFELRCPNSNEFGENLRYVDSDYHPVSVPVPISDKAWKRVAHLSYKEAKLVQFESHNCSDSAMKIFLKLSFGSVAHLRNPYYEEFFNQHTLHIDKCDSESVSQALSQQTRSWNYIYPIEFSSVDSPYFIGQNENSRLTYMRVVIGDSLQDMLWYWNQSLYSEKSNSLSQIYLPIELTKRDNLMVALGAWLKGRSQRSDHQSRLDITSVSLPQKQLTDISDAIFPQELKCHRRIYKPEFETKISRPRFTQFSLKDRNWPFSSISRIKETSQQCTSSESMIRVGEIEWPQTQTDSYRMIDFYIDYSPQTQTEFQRAKKQWLLAKREYLPSKMFDKRGRVDYRGIPTVLVGSAEDVVNLELPIEKDLFYNLIIRLHERFDDSDLRNPFRARSYDWMTLSSNGRYMNGILNLFHGDLDECCSVIESPFWNYIFERLAGEKTDKKPEKARELTLEEIICEAKNELSYYLVANPEERTIVENYRAEHPEDTDYPLKKDRIINCVTDFIKQGVLLPGIVLHCQECGLRSWKIIDEVNRMFRCSGCGRDQSMLGDEQIHFRVNNLLGEGIIAHGLMPVFRALNVLREENRNSFIFIESSDVYDGDSKQPITDLDIICLSGGKLHVGEAKQSWGQFKTRELRNLRTIGLKVRPDVFVIAAEGDPNIRIVKKIDDEVKSHLNKENIELKVICLPAIERGSDLHFY